MMVTHMGLDLETTGFKSRFCCTLWGIGCITNLCLSFVGEVVFLLSDYHQSPANVFEYIYSNSGVVL